MKEDTHLKPGQKGTRRLLEKYGDALLCVRYLYDSVRGVSLKTVEIIVEEKPGKPVLWINRRKNNRAFIEIKPAEAAFQEVVKNLNSRNIPFGTREDKYITFNLNSVELQSSADVHEWLAEHLAPEALKSA